MAMRDISKAQPVQLTTEEVAHWDAEIDQAEKELADPATRPAHVTLRWNQQPLDLVRRAAKLHGVPYQTYLKEAAVHQALVDLSMAEKVGVV